MAGGGCAKLTNTKGIQELCKFNCVASMRMSLPAKVDCALRLYVAHDAYRIAVPADLLDVLDRVIPGASDRLRRFGIHR